MLKNADILLIGPRASGKSMLGAMLARRINRAFVDLDRETLRTFNQPTIAEVWRTLGEPRWRAVEFNTLRCLLEERSAGSRAPAVIALGGGTAMIPGAADRLEHARTAGLARIIYLQCEPATLQERLRQVRGAADSRPPLIGADPVEEVPLVVAQREPVYLRLADEVVDANHPQPDAPLAALIVAVSRLAGRKTPGSDR